MPRQPAANCCLQNPLPEGRWRLEWLQQRPGAQELPNIVNDGGRN
jgi:hypothetical protein